MVGGLHGQVVDKPARQAAKHEPKVRRADSTTPAAAVQYQSGFGNHFVSEAVPGSLPVGRNSPQQLSGTSFTTPRAENRRTWTYRIQPSVVHRPMRALITG